MKDDLQDFSFDASEYERPSQKWVCGRSAEGAPCYLGPTRHGRCLFIDEHGREEPKYVCLPALDGVQPRCTRPKSRGGKCPHGPKSDGTCSQTIAKCQPARSMRAQRDISVYCTISITVGLLLVLLASPDSRSVLVSPGNLSHAHSTVAGGDEALSKTCKKCHSSGKSFLSGWLTSSLSTSVETTQSRLCLECHGLGDAVSALLAHSVPRATLTSSPNPNGLRRSSVESDTPATLSVARLLDDGPSHPNGEVSCATCHREHHGRDAPLTRISDLQCQICHAVAFGSFSSGHPDIAERYNFDEPMGLKFDHTSHLEVYFSLAGRDGEIQCDSCHMADRSGRHMILNNFDAICSECHVDQIVGDEGDDGIVFLNLPAFAQRLTRDQKDSIGAWPEKAGAKLSPYFRLLLVGDDAYPQDHDLHDDLERWSLLETTGRSGDGLSAGETEVVGRLAMAIRRFVDQLGDRDSVRRRIERAVGFPISSTESEALLGALAVSARFRLGVERWFLARQPGGSNEDVQNEFEEAWFREDGTYGVVYRPTRHAAPFLRTWLDLASRLLYNLEDGDPRRNIAAEILRGLEEEESPGSCLKCHKTDYLDSAGRIKWNAASPSEPGLRSTVFSHYPHCALVRCTSCHERRPEGTTPTDSQPADERWSGRIAGDFASIGVQNCSRCHVSELAGDSCLQCHYYHFGKITQRVTKTFPSSMEPHGD